MSDYRLIIPTEKELAVYYGWMANEGRRERFSCRPINELGPLEAYIEKTLVAIEKKTLRPWMLVGDDDVPLGQIKGFDHNPRNHGMEFGYYMPEGNRGRGYGNLMIGMYLAMVFEDVELDLNRLYATTADNNAASIKLLEANGFSLDGRNREAYWIGSDRYDQRVYSILRREYRLVPEVRVRGRVTDSTAER